MATLISMRPPLELYPLEETCLTTALYPASVHATGIAWCVQVIIRTHRCSNAGLAEAANKTRPKQNKTKQKTNTPQTFRDIGRLIVLEQTPEEMAADPGVTEAAAQLQIKKKAFSKKAKLPLQR